MKYKYLLLLFLMLPFVCGCNDSDDVNGILTGEVRKLTYTTKENDHKSYGLWGNKDKHEQSIKNYVNKGGAYTIRFEREDIDDVIGGESNGMLPTYIYTEAQSANSESSAFSASAKGSESDPLGFSNKSVGGLNRATSYKGNYGNLFIYYKDEGDGSLCLVFHVDK